MTIQGITTSSLWGSWKEVRNQLKQAPRRDILDYLEYDIDPDVWIKKLLRRLKNAEYTPEHPNRYSLAKSKGFDRIITLPQIPDLVLYRTIVDFLFRKAQKKQRKHAYFCRATLSKITAAAEKEGSTEIATEISKEGGTESALSRGSFLEWLKFDQYRKLLIFEKLYPYIVVTDITNFFDSVLYGRIEESLYGLSAPPRLISLLFLLLESFSPREAFTPVQRIGLPVDPCDCSRVLAHMILFPHDDRMVDRVGEDAYVRWMDDQNIGAASRAEGLRILSAVGDSLRRLHLTPNSSKSRILSLVDAKKHFHFSANRDLDRIEKLPYSSAKEQRILRKEITKAWNSAKSLEGIGEWEKILKRFYRYAARANSKLFIRRASEDIKSLPGLVERVCDYIRYVLEPSEILNFVEKLLKDPEQIYPDVNYQLIECLLLVFPDKPTGSRICRLGASILSETISFPGVADAKALAPLMILRYGDKRHLRALFNMLQKDADKLPSNVTRAVCAVVSGCGKAGFSVVLKTASRLLRNHLSEFVKLVVRIKQFDTVPGRFKNRVAVGRDSITGAKYVDMRSLLAARILALCAHHSVQKWLVDTKKAIISSNISEFDRRLIRRLWPV